MPNKNLCNKNYLYYGFLFYILLKPFCLYNEKFVRKGQLAMFESVEGGNYRLNFSIKGVIKFGVTFWVKRLISLRKWFK